MTYVPRRTVADLEEGDVVIAFVHPLEKATRINRLWKENGGRKVVLEMDDGTTRTYYSYVPATLLGDVPAP